MSNDLGEELIDEILSRLPSKSLLRFRSLSKSVCARIRSQGFIRLHTLRSPNKVLITHNLGNSKKINTLHSKGRFPNIGIPLQFPFLCGFSIVGSCNGILCVYEYRRGDIHLWNPSIRRKVTVHDCYWRNSICGRIYEGVIVLGFDVTIDDYSIFKITRHTSFIYTMKTHTWREIASPTEPFTFLKLYQCRFNGALYWAVKRDLTDAGGLCHYYIMKFCLSSEFFSTIELPEPTWEINQVTIIKGCLAVISSEAHGCSRIWVRREYNNTDASWSLSYKLVINPFQTALGVFQITPNDELLYVVNSNGILAYNVGTKELSSVVDLSDYSASLVGMCMYVESLELLGMGISCDRTSEYCKCRLYHNTLIIIECSTLNF